ncbi:hypothetical protein Q5P01_000045 [Channa striata]|uniref:Uncharacterized protein n=1 Tax=Channa striata TaxID=64152 RepID=A0AA88IGT2_CHASR|nr:hypothetical protein Q5P01_000045 [Channa striata]
MLSQFERQPNIAVLNLERDLKDALPEVMYQENYSADLNLMDYLRRSNQASVQCARCVARRRPRRGKVATPVPRWDRRNAIIYSDIDITWNDRVPNVLAHRGMCSAPSLKDFSFQHVCFRPSKDDAPRLSDRVLAKAKEHSAMFSSNSRKQDATVRARGAGRLTLRQHTAVSGNRGRRSLIVDFHSMSAPNPDPRRVENHTPIFMQLLPLMAMGEDRTWSERGID